MKNNNLQPKRKAETVKVLEAINPYNSGTGQKALGYLALQGSVEKYKKDNSLRESEFWQSVDNSLESENKARQLASEYLLRTALKLNESNEDNRDLWADRFTQSSIEIYGEPDNAESTRLLSNEYNTLLKLKNRNDIPQKELALLLDTYSGVLEDSDADKSLLEAESQAEKEAVAIREYGDLLQNKFRKLFDIVDNSEKTEYSPQDIKEVFEQCLSELSANDSTWNEWEVVFKDKTMVSVDAFNKKPVVGTKRPNNSPENVRGLISHEILVHALRANNGYKTGDKELATGLPGYLDAEEGFGILSEFAVNGKMPERAYDRYVDIFLALGSNKGKQLKRKDLFEISYSRQLIREKLKGNIKSEDDINNLKDSVWVHIDRIYRGGPGDESEHHQGIFTKDIAYYGGYKKWPDICLIKKVQVKP